MLVRVQQIEADDSWYVYGDDIQSCPIVVHTISSENNESNLSFWWLALTSKYQGRIGSFTSIFYVEKAGDVS